ncbi:MAG TPA: glycosyltransferase family protein [Nevskiaceae bacterium]|nr:glycosyltransferase family protein [Nevskiaceae bacterium]
MRIAYGVMGYGRGHAMRTASVLPALMKEHEVTVFAAEDAYEALAPDFPTVRIPLIRYVYNDHGRHSLLRTVRRNLAPMADLLFGGEGCGAVERAFRERGIQLVISDSEAWTHRAAQKLGLPRISFDHVGVIAYCKPHFPPDLWLTGMRDALAYRQLMGIPERILISSFYRAEPALPHTRIVGPMLRDVVKATPARHGDYLLAYFNKGQHQYGPALDRTLRLLDLPVVVYGTPYRGRVDNLDFRAPSQEGFVRDLAGCRAVISTAGNQTLGEAIHFRKPVLALPEDAFEQRLNAFLVEQMGIGSRADLNRVTPSDVDRFLTQHERYVANMGEQPGDGRAEAIETLHRYIGELVRQPRRSRRPRAAVATAPLKA